MESAACWTSCSRLSDKTKPETVTASSYSIHKRIMPDNIRIAYCYAEDVGPDTVRSIFDVVLEYGGRGTFDNDEFKLGYWDETGTLHGKNGVPEELIEPMVTAEMYSVGANFDEFNLSIGHDAEATPGGDHIVISVITAPFRDRGGSEQLVQSHRETLVDFLVALAERTNPIGGAGMIRKNRFDAIPAIENYRDGTVPFLFEYNLFNQQCVARLGRDTVLEAPAWRTEELSTGGILMILAEPPYACVERRDRCEAASRQLGIPLMTW